MSSGLRFFSLDDLGRLPLSSWGVSSSGELDTYFEQRWDGIHRPDNESDRLLAELDGMTVVARGEEEEV